MQTLSLILSAVAAVLFGGSLVIPLAMGRHRTTGQRAALSRRLARAALLVVVVALAVGVGSGLQGCTAAQGEAFRAKAVQLPRYVCPVARIAPTVAAVVDPQAITPATRQRIGDVVAVVCGLFDALVNTPWLESGGTSDAAVAADASVGRD